MDELRPVRCEFTMEEASLLADLLKNALGGGGGDETINAVLARIQYAEDHALERATMRGPANDGAEYEW